MIRSAAIEPAMLCSFAAAAVVRNSLRSGGCAAYAVATLRRVARSAAVCAHAQQPSSAVFAAAGVLLTLCQLTRSRVCAAIGSAALSALLTALCAHARCQWRRYAAAINRSCRLDTLHRGEPLTLSSRCSRSRCSGALRCSVAALAAVALQPSVRIHARAAGLQAALTSRLRCVRCASCAGDTLRCSCAARVRSRDVSCACALVSTLSIWHALLQLLQLAASCSYVAACAWLQLAARMCTEFSCAVTSSFPRYCWWLPLRVYAQIRCSSELRFAALLTAFAPSGGCAALCSVDTLQH
ncbi:hypothetical protein KOW79_013520 [Hemibagrus wyckioides]|uniref:Uncharacterized protein n=1 Tax=Hemibagrus wyckioides TaxID=337641 RepID=A0A9D3NM95_9TELE|nr:hypothetical protein KOW79_013520 [Hemibagrus wyckioides]